MYSKNIIGLGGVRKIRSIKIGDLFKDIGYSKATGVPFVFKIVRKYDKDEWIADRYIDGIYEGETYLHKVVIQRNMRRVYKIK